MSFKEQTNRLKENWFIILLIVVLLFVIVPFIIGIGGITNYSARDMVASYDQGFTNEAMGKSSYYYGETDFAPEITDRIVTISSSLSSEVEYKDFESKENEFKGILSEYDTFILNENVYESGFGKKKYMNGSYTIKVNSEEYLNLVDELKTIGEVKSFSENKEDITGSYTNKNIELELEKEKLRKYNELYDTNDISMEDKLDLTDKIFYQERRVKYLEDSINNMDKRVEYSTINYSLREKQSSYADVILVKFSELIKTLVSSFNVLLHIIFAVVPFVVLTLLIVLFARRHKKRR
ncbi:MAG: DUF4349 domain-containing protein [Candidatus ainarchaeum sp.]|nr:DUF4349 domain-containing protein [Candidatus ainarchaeum sp.]MDD3975930.1 DUF4349 domain-containing protein [Candidatus ainarchaeum sp.]